MESVQESPEEKFKEFLRTFKSEDGTEKYRNRLSNIAVSGTRSLIISFEDLISFDSELAKMLIQKPDDLLELFCKSALAQLAIEDPEYAESIDELHVRFRRLPDRVQLRKVGSEYIGKLISLDGIIVRSTPIKSLIVKAAFKCKSCGEISLVEQTELTLTSATLCAYCNSKHFTFSAEDSKFIDFQTLRIQERPEDLPPGQLPRTMDVKITDDLVDVARPGDRVIITGVVRAEQDRTIGSRLRIFDLFEEANFIDIPSRETEVIELTPEEEEEIKKLAQDPWIHRQLIKSVAPSIYGYEDIKESILYLLFGGASKDLPDGVRIRGDVNVLIVGDPGTAKSALLQYVARISPRGLYTSGRGSTAAGLTAAVLREKAGGMVLEAGALVLADKGVASVDEIDKMRPEDRVAMHEAMEQQTVSVAKGGIVATLNARAAILAAANPALGRYDPYRLIAENITLPVTILSRFDLIFIIRDTPDVDRDSLMSEHILKLHKERVSPEEPPIATELFRKYISYAKRIEPKLSEEADKTLKEFYLKMRASSASSPDSPISITPRQLEALVRLSEARARTFLRTSITAEDAEAIIRLMNVSLSNVGLDTTTGKIDIDVIMTGKSKSLRDIMQIIRTTVSELEEKDGLAEEDKVVTQLLEDVGYKEEDVRRGLDQLRKEGLLYSPKPGFLKRTSS